MSYEGFTEYLCPNGHYWSYDVYFESEDRHVCKVCGAVAKWGHDVDQTNGIDLDDPSTMRGEVKQIGFMDAWHTDHYGNRWAQKILLLEPASGSDWRLFKNN